VKTIEIVNDRTLEAQFEREVRRVLKRAPSLEIKSSGVSNHSEIDSVFRVLAGKDEWILALEGKREGYPRSVRVAVSQLEHYLRQLPSNTHAYGVVAAPFISQASAQICEEAGVGYVDLAGNALLAFDHVFIETRSSENPFREKRELRSLFAPRATRVLRVMLQGPLRTWKVKELAEASRVSLGWVSAVRKELLAREWAEKVERSGIRVKHPDALLDTWAKSDRWADRVQAREYSSLTTDPVEIGSRSHEYFGDHRHAFTQWLAAELRHPYTTAPLVSVYVDEFPDDADLRQKLGARRVEEGGRLRLVVPKDAGVFNPAQIVNGFPLVSDVQIYLDLINAGLRGDEAANELRRWPDFSGGWA
jgi:hypothetical protein